jgi:hypothetical protein
MSLVDLTGKPAGGPVIRFPSGGPDTAVPDGRGDVLVVNDESSVFDAGPGWDIPVPGVVAAVGASGWLVVLCNSQYRHCRTEMVAAGGSTRRILPGPGLTLAFYATWPPVGVIAPDGGVAAVPDPGHTGLPTLHLVNLRSGSSRAVGIPLDLNANDQQMVWSPDSRWLFVTEPDGGLVAVNARTGRAEGLGVSLPPVSQVAIRA